MPNDDAEAKLNELEKRLQDGWEKLHPIKQSHLEAVRNVVREQWKERQKNAAVQKALAAKQNQGKIQTQKRKTTKQISQKKGHGHSH